MSKVYKPLKYLKEKEDEMNKEIVKKLPAFRQEYSDLCKKHGLLMEAQVKKMGEGIFVPYLSIRLVQEGDFREVEEDEKK